MKKSCEKLSKTFNIHTQVLLICTFTYLQQEPFDVAEFIERLTWRTNNEIGTDHFDPDVLHETFVQTIKDLKILQEKQQKKCERLEEALKEEQKIYARNINKLQERHQVSTYHSHRKLFLESVAF